MKRILSVFVISMILPSLLLAKQFQDFKFTGLFSQRGHIPLYVKTSENLSISACLKMSDTVKLGGATTIGNICEASCKRGLNPDWFIPFVAAKKSKIPNSKAKTDLTTVSFEEDWDQVYFCGWNPENGLSEKDIGQQGISTINDLATANLLCKKGTDKNIIYLIGLSDMQTCLSDCNKCSIPANWKD
jgi:hypothetical protein